MPFDFFAVERPSFDGHNLECKSPDGARADKPVLHEVLLHDVSVVALLLRSPHCFEIGEIVTVSLPDAGVQAARVNWRDGEFYGCDLLKPIPLETAKLVRMLAPIHTVLTTGNVAVSQPDPTPVRLGSHKVRVRKEPPSDTLPSGKAGKLNRVKGILLPTGTSWKLRLRMPVRR